MPTNTQQAVVLTISPGRCRYYWIVVSLKSTHTESYAWHQLVFLSSHEFNLFIAGGTAL